MIFILPAAGYVAIQFPALQTWIAHKAVKSIEDKIDGKIEVEKVAISFLNKIIIKNASITNAQGDTLGSVGKLSVTLSLLNMTPGFLEAKRIIVEDGYFNLQLDKERGSNLAEIFRIEPKPKDTTSSGEWGIPNIAVNDIIISNFHFNMHNKAKDTIVKPYGCMNYNHFNIYDIDVRLTRAKYENKKLTCRIRSLTCKDSCGYEVKSLSADYSMDSTQIKFDNLYLKDSYSTVNAKYLSFGYTKGRDINDYVNKIVMGADFFNTTLDFRTVGVYAPSLIDNRLTFLIDGEVIGPVRDLRSNDLRVRTGDSTDVRVGVAITGLPKIQNTVFNFTFKDVNTTLPEVGMIVSSFSKSFNKSAFESLIPDIRLNVQGVAYGTLSDVYSMGKVSSRIGEVDYFAQTYPALDGNGRDISVEVGAKDLNAGKIIGSKNIGESSFSTAIHANITPTPEGRLLNASLDSLLVHKLFINGYNFSGITAVGDIRNNVTNIRLISKNDALPLLFQGIVHMDEKFDLENIKAYLNIPEADLAAAGIDKKNNLSLLGITSDINLSKGENDIMLGKIMLNDINYTNDKGSHKIDNIMLRSFIQEEVSIITLDSPMLVAKYLSDDIPSNLVKRIKNALFRKDIPILLSDNERSLDSTNIENQGNYKFSLQTFDLAPICRIVLPDLYIADSTKVDFLLTQNDSLVLTANSEFIRWGKNIFNNFALSLDNQGYTPHLDLTAEKISLFGVELNENRFCIKGEDGGLNLNYKFVNDNILTNSLDFNSKIEFNKDESGKLSTTIALKESELYIKSRNWKINPSKIWLGSKFYKADSLMLYNENESLLVNGTISESPTDTMHIDMERFDISLANSFISNGTNLQGLLSGKIDVYDIYNRVGILMAIDGEDIVIDNRSMDRISVMSKWDQNRERFNILVTNHQKETNPLNISGYYTPTRKYLNLNAVFNNFKLEHINPILKSVMNISGGALNGELNISGETSKLIMKSYETYVDSLRFTPNYTKVTYDISGPIDIDKSGIYLKEIIVEDPFKNKAKVTGAIRHEYFKNMILDARLDFSNFQCLDTKERDNSTFYGQAFASGNIVLEGPFEDLFIDADIRTEDNTIIHVPLSSASSAKQTDLITFENFSRIVNDRHYYSYDEEENTSKNKSNIELKAKASISDNTQLLIELNKSLGDILKCRGNGNIDLVVNPSRNVLDIRGDYIISEGNYHFAVSIGAKDFILNEGGSLSFNGGVMNTSLNVGATYQTKASVATLISDTTSVASRRTVNCGINLKGSLVNPEISFSIDIPDLDPITKSRVESALSTPDKVQKQFMALLLSGSFVPDEQSGIFNNTTILYSNASEIVANQFNNIFRQLDLPLDLGLNFQPGSASGGRDMFDVALSYQAFNNRLIINGNVGNSINSNSNWAGNLEIEYKVGKQGKLRLSGFTRAADSYSNYLDNTQRSGIGISFQDEFDTFKEFFRNLFLSRKRKEQYELERMKEALDELKKEAAEANIKKEDILKPKEDPLKLNDQQTELIEYNQ
ncbi:MAG: translocation/assembly module TamB domain-containing protein [Bacteroidales bacterium]|nr:translocation/assembly module TamB domain-containing protein [Bacteroidales bacterium]